jgi:hypothetical protein
VLLVVLVLVLVALVVALVVAAVMVVVVLLLLRCYIKNKIAVNTQKLRSVYLLKLRVSFSTATAAPALSDPLRRHVQLMCWRGGPRRSR